MLHDSDEGWASNLETSFMCESRVKHVVNNKELKTRDSSDDSVSPTNDYKHFDNKEIHENNAANSKLEEQKSKVR